MKEFFFIIFNIYDPNIDFFGAYFAKPPGSMVALESRQEAAQALLITFLRRRTLAINNFTNITNNKIYLIKKLPNHLYKHLNRYKLIDDFKGKILIGPCICN